MKAALTLTVLFLAVLLVAKEKPNLSVVPVEETVTLETMTVRTTPNISYPIDLSIRRDPSSLKVVRIFITKVWDDPYAENAGLQVGDEIIRINGRAVTEFDARIGQQTELGRLLLNRDPGDRLNLDVVTRRVQSTTLRAIHPMLRGGISP